MKFIQLIGFRIRDRYIKPIESCLPDFRTVELVQVHKNMPQHGIIKISDTGSAYHIESENVEAHSVGTRAITE
jgi:hypothetical protein